MHDKSGGHRPPLNNPAGEPSLLGGSDRLEANRTRNLQLLRAGSFQLAIFEDEIATVVEWRDPAPLPYAPTVVLGVVSIQGRMLTVLDLAILLSAKASPNEGPSQHILALRGDEQLALAVDALGETIGIAEGKVEPAEGLFLRVFKHRNREISILNTKELFATALHGRERRRRRF
ncbi:MAG: chemotaxis protein CheW [Acidobacteriota bacterium]|nr:chemotaxis protein CheW [Acidobacteriota bacterium]